MHARWWQSGELKQLRNFSTVWQAADRVVMMMLEPDYFNACIDHRRCAAYVGPYRDRERIMAGLRTQWKRSLEIPQRSEEHTSELQSLMRISYAVFCLKKKKTQTKQNTTKTKK